MLQGSLRAPMSIPSAAQAFAETVGALSEIVGIGVIVVGALAATIATWRHRHRYVVMADAFEAYRNLLARAILLGLEFLVAADIIRTVATAPTLQNLAVLAVIVAIRTFLSWSIGLEIEGRFPWQQRRNKAPD